MFEQSSYSVREGDNFTQVCVITNNEALLERSVQFRVATSEDSASEGNDFMASDTPLVFSSPPFRQCVDIVIATDDRVEAVELFSVLLDSDDPSVTIQTPSTSVAIFDDSVVRVSFIGGPFEVTEGGEPATVCAMTLDPIDRDVEITLNVDDTDSKLT